MSSFEEFSEKLNLNGFTNFRTVKLEILQQSLQSGAVSVITPEKMRQLNDDIQKSLKEDFDGKDTFEKARDFVAGFYSLMVDEGHQVREYFVKPNAKKQNDSIQKGIDTYAFGSALQTAHSSALPIKMTGEELKEKLRLVRGNLVVESDKLLTCMQDCLVLLNLIPTEQHWDSSCQKHGRRFSWEVVRSLDGNDNLQTIDLLSSSNSSATSPAPINKAREYNECFEKYCSNQNAISLIDVYLNTLEDEVIFSITPQFYNAITI